MIHPRCILECSPAFSCLLSLYFYFTSFNALSCTNRLIVSDLWVYYCRYNLLKSFTTMKRHYTSILQSSFHFGSDVHITQTWPTYFLSCIGTVSLVCHALFHRLQLVVCYVGLAVTQACLTLLPTHHSFPKRTTLHLT